MGERLQLDLFGGPPVEVPYIPLDPLRDADPDLEPPALDREGFDIPGDPEVGPPDDPGAVPEEQLFLFDLTEPWRIEWAGMPEFTQEDLTPFKSITVHFESQADIILFEQLIGQSTTSGRGMAAGSIWYPELEATRMMDKRYVSK